MEVIRKRVKEARERRGLTIEEASELAGVSFHQWKNFEWNGRTIPTWFGDMCRTVGIDPVKLLRERGIVV